MAINIPLLNSCGCFSLRIGVVILGSLQLFLYLLYFFSMLTIRLRYMIEYQSGKYLVLIEDILFEYVKILELVFNGVLIYGAIKEKSGFITTWLLAELAKIIDVIWNAVLITQMWFHWRFVIEQCILNGLYMISMWIVYSFYNTMPKSKYIL
nr:uncharacterized protein LOC106682004 [Halyomorpha halys]XP_014278115.1 uncharacterized protein LOC106682004 [Halyomorpha halys]